MRFSRWQAQGNVYLVAEEALTADAVRGVVGDADGILEVKDRGRDWVEIAIWNSDGSLAEMSGNGTRIAACWLARQTGADMVTVRVGDREVLARMLAPPFVEQRLPYRVGEAGTAAGVRFTPVDVGNPHAVVEADPADVTRLGPAIENSSRTARTCRSRTGSTTRRSRRECGSAAWGRRSRRARAPSRSRLHSARRTSRSASRAATSTSGWTASSPT